MNVGAVQTLPIFMACPYTHVERSIPLAMNVAGVYTLPIFIAFPFTPCRGVYSPCKIEGVHTLQIFIVRPYTPYSGVYTPRDECTRGCTPLQYSWCAPIPSVEVSIPLAMNIGAVYTLPIFIACPISL